VCSDSSKGGNAAVLIFFETRFSVDSTQQTILSTGGPSAHRTHAFACATHWSHATSSKLGLSRACAGLKSLCGVPLFIPNLKQRLRVVVLVAANLRAWFTG
jgi:hypothetical protein